MKKILIIRHAKSKKNEDVPFLSDFDRPLTNKGKGKATLAGSILKKKEITPDIFLSSPAKRAKKTSVNIARELYFDEKKIVYDMRIYEATATVLLDIIHEVPDSFETIYICGHNPGVSELRSYLTGEAAVNLPASSVSLLEVNVSSWKKAVKKAAKISFYDDLKSYCETCAL